MKTIVIDGKRYTQVKTPDEDYGFGSCSSCAFESLSKQCMSTRKPAIDAFGGDCAETDTIYQEVA